MGERSSPRHGWWDPEGTPAGGTARYSVAGARLAVRFRGGGGRRLIAGGRGFRKVAEHLAGNFAPDAVKAADLREHTIATDPFGGAADKAQTVSLIGFRRGIRMAFDAGFAIAVQIGDGAGISIEADHAVAGEVEGFEDVADAGLQRVFGDVVEAAGEFEEFLSGEAVEKDRGFRDVADNLFDGDGLF